ncbi:conserved hypothetical protein [Candidatus Desulfarcum epimagneticum]|uniref:ABC transporter domain-containing protein n=1 Tax=uncultured Desulfobacteraceae bacterium TaxID=218296 RepID=A0A484HBT6_9BACT|nr:conserved hypothetical protein [uncultured Desulfobacteraceae bacterium]
MSAYVVSNLARVRGGRNILDIASLEIDRGKMYAVKGPNGAGKTSLLEILAFLDAPDSGRMVYEGVRVNFSSRPLLGRLRKEASLVEQSPIMFTCSVFKNVEFGLKARKVEKSARRRAAARALEMVGMERLAHAPAHRLSGGETQRVALARAMAVMPRVLICDEPTSSVDAKNKAAIMDILRRANEKDGVTVIFATHDHDRSLAAAHHTLTLEYGKITNLR